MADEIEKKENGTEPWVFDTGENLGETPFPTESVPQGATPYAGPPKALTERNAAMAAEIVQGVAPEIIDAIKRDRQALHDAWCSVPEPAPAQAISAEAEYMRTGGGIPNVRCNCDFNQGHEPHCAVVLAHDLAQLRETLAQKEGEVARWKREANVSEVNLQDARQSLARVEGEWDAARQLVEEAGVLLKRIIGERDDMERARDLKQQSVGNLITQVSALTAERDALRAQVEEARKAFERELAEAKAQEWQLMLRVREGKSTIVWEDQYHYVPQARLDAVSAERDRLRKALEEASSHIAWSMGALSNERFNGSPRHEGMKQTLKDIRTLASAEKGTAPTA